MHLIYLDRAHKEHGGVVLFPWLDEFHHLPGWSVNCIIIQVFFVQIHLAQGWTQRLYAAAPKASMIYIQVV